ncbi:MAG: hypothetical protein RLZZ225_598 [Pseudomonadota bacterium]|jgi:hypothetical protein
MIADTDNSSEDSFVLLEGEVPQAPKEFRYGNHQLDTQLKRDIEYLSLAIVYGGPLESERIKALTLLKSILFLYFGNMCYRDASDRKLHPWNTLNSYLQKDSLLKAVPIAAILLHGSRALIEFPPEIAEHLMDWFIIDKMSWRYLATHSISVLDKAEVLNAIWKKPLKNKVKVLNPVLKKCLKEEKISAAHAAIKLFSNSMVNFFSIIPLKLFKNLINLADEPKYTEHYGIDLALGGDGNRHFASQKRIQNNGEHGHLYVNCYTAAPKQYAGLLLGIEQSAPGKVDQYGGAHDMAGSDKQYSASGGDFFGKKIRPPAWVKVDYKGLSALPLAAYYDSLWNFISIDSFELIKVAFRKCEILLGLLPEEKSLDFIQEIVSSAGSATKEEFDQLFEHYFQQIPQVKLEYERQVALSSKVEILKQQIKSMPSDNKNLQQAPNSESAGLKAQITRLRNENNRLKKQLHQGVNLLKEEVVVSESRQLQSMILLTNNFMQTVVHSMGWFAQGSTKKNILLTLQQQFERTGGVAISVDNILCLLKNFIAVSLMNRYSQTSDATATAKACLSLLRHPAYQKLTARLFPQCGEIDYQDLLNLVAGDIAASKQYYFYSAKYQKNLYHFYTVGSRSKDKAADNILNLAMSRPLYTAPH